MLKCLQILNERTVRNEVHLPIRAWKAIKGLTDCLANGGVRRTLTGLDTSFGVPKSYIDWLLSLRASNDLGRHVAMCPHNKPITIVHRNGSKFSIIKYCPSIFSESPQVYVCMSLKKVY